MIINFQGWEAFEEPQAETRCHSKVLLLLWILQCNVDEWSVCWVSNGREKQMVCLFPFKANTTKQSREGKGHGGRGGQCANWPRPPSQSSNQPDTKKAASDNTNSTTIGSGGSQSAAEKWWLSIAGFFFSVDSDRDRWLVALVRFGRSDCRKMRRKNV